MGRRERAAKLHGGGGRWRATQVSRFSRHHRQLPVIGLSCLNCTIRRFRIATRALSSMSRHFAAAICKDFDRFTGAERAILQSCGDCHSRRARQIRCQSLGEKVTSGIPTPAFLTPHVVLSLIGIAIDLVVVFGMLTGRRLAGWTVAFLLTTAPANASDAYAPDPRSRICVA